MAATAALGVERRADLATPLGAGSIRTAYDPVLQTELGSGSLTRAPVYGAHELIVSRTRARADAPRELVENGRG